MGSKIIFHRRETKYRSGFRVEVDTRIIKNSKKLKYTKIVRRDYYKDFWFYSKYLWTKYQVFNKVYFKELLKYNHWLNL